MISQKVVMPAQAGIHAFCNIVNRLDSRLRRDFEGAINLTTGCRAARDDNNTAANLSN